MQFALLRGFEIQIDHEFVFSVHEIFFMNNDMSFNRHQCIIAVQASGVMEFDRIMNCEFRLCPTL